MSPILSRPRVASVMAAVLIAGVLHASPASAAAKPYTPAATKPVPVVPVRTAATVPAPPARVPAPASARPAPIWPEAGTEVVDATATGASAALPVRVAGRAGISAPRVRVEMLDRATTERAGVRGVLMRVGRADGVATAGAATVTVDYRKFATAYGADWSSRLRLVSLPACALTTPAKAACAARPLPSKNDVKTGTVSADLTVGGPQSLVAATAAASGPAGDYSASTLSPSSTWSAGGNTGAFTWSYEMRTPPSLGGPSPSLSLSYSSQSVDGKHAASNNQPGWVGEGFETKAGGFIERSYVACAEDKDGSANNAKDTGDLCWETSNATLSLDGHSGELIYNADENRWHLRGDDGSKIERRTGGVNGDNDGEHWVVTTTDGVQYWFGLNRLPGWAAGDPVTNSALTAPVFGNDPSEPCHATAFADSDCTQAWRWNLDYVVDPLGNSMSYWYQKEANKYGRNIDPDDAASYDRSAWLDRIDYGTRRIDGVDSALGTLAPMRVDFGVADRCLSDCGTHDAVHWPDVPWDSSCTGDSCSDDFSPSFWTTKRLTTVTTQVRAGTAYRNVERWTLGQTFPDPGDGTRAGLWLSTLSHTGLIGGSAPVPNIEFTPVQKPNRVDTIDFAAAMNWMRIARIRNETGGSISVDYSEQDCQANQPRPAPETNTRRCYPVRWIPEGYQEPVTDWFNKYVVTTIYENDNTGGAPPNGSPRVVHTYQYFDGAAWHYTDDDGLVKKKYKTWSDYRGYGRVGVTTGDPGEQTYTESRYFRGMNGDRLDSSGGRKPADVDGITDEDWFAGRSREQKAFNGPGGAVVSREISTPWASAATATRTINGDTVTARYTGVGTTTSHTTLDAGRGERVTKSVTTFDGYGMPTAVDDLGVDGVAGDERCTKKEYLRNTTAWILNREKRIRTFAVKCADSDGTLADADVIDETRQSFDGKAYGTAPTKGLVTQTQTMSAWKSGAPTFTVAAKATYDVHGRILAATDALDNVSTSTYTPAADGPVTSTLATNALLQETTTNLEPAWGQPTSTIDPNGKRTDLTYDPLGRRTAVWTPGHAKGTDPAVAKYAYDLNTDGATAVSSSTLSPAGAYVTSYTLYDGLLRARETQSPSPSGGRIITENFYDTAGRASLTFGGYHTTGAPGSTLLAATDRAFVPRQTRTVYDGAGRTTAEIFQPYGFERWRTTTGYGGDRTDVTPPAGGTATSAVVDARGHTVEVRQYHGPAATPQTVGSWDTAGYTFDRRGYQTKVADTLGNNWTYKYDVRGRQTEVVDPDKGKTSFTYDNAGNVLTSTDARGKKLAFLTDPLGRKVATYDNQVGGTMRAQWIYDTVAKGQLSQSTRFVGSAPYQVKVLDYDDDYQPGNTQVIIPGSETGLTGTYNYGHTYNTDGSPHSTSIPATNTGLPAETLTYGYTALGAPATLDGLYGTQNLSYIEDADYNALGELDQIDRYTGSGGHVYTAYSRDLATGRLTGVRTDRDSVAPYTVADTSYQYDPAGNITKVADAAPDPADDTQCFSHDHLRRLTAAWTPASGDCAAAPSTTLLGGPAAYWNSWQYDEIGNRTTETVHSVTGDTTTGYTYPKSGSTTVRPHAVTGTTGARTGSYTYDATGNELTRPTPSSGTQTMTWDAEGNLETSTDAGGQNTYIYDADGNRLIRRDPTGRTLYLPGEEIRYTAGTGSTACTRYYTFAGSAIGSRTATGLTWLAPDHQGTAQVAVEAVTQQSTVRRQTPFGTPRGAGTSWPNDKGFLGGTDDNTGLTHLGAREYDTALGRFVSVDPVQDLSDPQQWNAYAYAANSPITSSDPSGLSPTPDMLPNYDGDGSDSGGGGVPCPECDGTSGGDDDGGDDGGSSSDSDVDPGSATVELDDTTKKGIYNQGYGSGTFTVNELLQWASISTANWIYLCTNVTGKDSMTCELNNPTLPEKSGGQQFLEGALIVGGYGGAAFCVLFIEICGPAIVGMAEDEAAFAGSGSLLGPASGVTRAGSAILREGALCSFSGDTEVLLDAGETKPFKDLRAGDEVLSADPETGERGLRKIEQVWVHQDDLYVLTIGGERLVTTEDHPFWDETDQQWEGAENLDTGDLVRTPHGTARVDGFNRSDHRYAAAYNLTVADIHTYYVLAGNTPVLVHNRCGEFVHGDIWTGSFDVGGQTVETMATVRASGDTLHLDGLMVFPRGTHGLTRAPIGPDAVRQMKVSLAEQARSQGFDSVVLTYERHIPKADGSIFKRPGTMTLNVADILGD